MFGEDVIEVCDRLRRQGKLVLPGENLPRGNNEVLIGVVSRSEPLPSEWSLFDP